MALRTEASSKASEEDDCILPPNAGKPAATHPGVCVLANTAKKGQAGGPRRKRWGEPPGVRRLWSAGRKGCWGAAMLCCGGLDGGVLGAHSVTDDEDVHFRFDFSPVCVIPLVEKCLKNEGNENCSQDLS